MTTNAKSLITRFLFMLLAMFFVLLSNASPEGPPKPTEIRTYKTVGTTDLKAHIFLPAHSAKGELRPAVILLHGGGWNVGSADWMYDDANWYAGFNMVAVAGEYRLSDQKTATPLEAMEDTRDLVRWVRQHAAELAVDPHKIAIYASMPIFSDGTRSGNHPERGGSKQPPAGFAELPFVACY